MPPARLKSNCDEGHWRLCASYVVLETSMLYSDQLAISHRLFFFFLAVLSNIWIWQNLFFLSFFFPASIDGERRKQPVMVDEINIT